jgi:virginiamycin A acetyltransferase
MARLTVTQRLLDLLREHSIFHSYGGADRWAPGTTILVAEGCEIEPYAQVFVGTTIPRSLGAFSYCNSPFDASMSIGRYASLASQVSVLGEDHPMGWASTSPIFYQPVPGGPANPGFRTYRARAPMDVRPHLLGEQAVVIGHDVWIGEQVLLKRGVTIGSGAVIGARSLVLEDVPPYAVVVGQPARVVKYRFGPELIARFLQLEWWRFAPAELSRLPLEEPAAFLDALGERIDTGALEPMRPMTLRWPQMLEAARDVAGA